MENVIPRGRGDERICNRFKRTHTHTRGYVVLRV